MTDPDSQLPANRNALPDELAVKRLERQLGQLLGSLPDQSAPASLEQRVLSRLAAEARLPWYRCGFSRWPGAARVLFLPVALAGAAVTMGLASRIGAAIPSALPAAGALHSGTRVSATWNALRDAGHAIGGLVTHVVPMPWLYGAAAVVVAGYLLTILLGTVALRTLLPHPQRT
jgi:hypothetical protein